MKTREQGCGAGSIEAFVVIKDANLQGVHSLCALKTELAELFSIKGVTVCVKVAGSLPSRLPGTLIP
jgi:hypothetical protein